MELNKIFKPFKKIDIEDEMIGRLFSISSPLKVDGAVQDTVSKQEHDHQKILDGFEGDSYGFNNRVGYNTEIVARTVANRINQYRDIVRYHEVNNIVNQIANDAIIYDTKREVNTLDLSLTSFKPKIQEMIQKEFKEVKRLLEVQKRGIEYFKRWYIDSRIYFYKVIDPNKPQDGIKELRRLDPRYVTFKRRNIFEEDQYGNRIYIESEEFFIYEDLNQTLSPYGYGNINTNDVMGAKRIAIPKNAITFAHSGLEDCNHMIIGHLQQAIKPANTLKLLEDAMVVYRVTRAPDRKVFYIDTQQMPPAQATQYIRKIKDGLTKDVKFDRSTGKFNTTKHDILSTDDYYLQRSEGKAIAEVQTLPGASGLNEIDDIRWHNKKLYEALQIPLSRMPNENAGVVFGNDGEITRDELLYQKFIAELRHQYEPVFLDPLRTNLILKNIISVEEWEMEKENIRVMFNDDEYFKELSELDLMTKRYSLLELLYPIIGKYKSHKTIQKDILKMTDEEIALERAEILKEEKDEIYNPPEEFGDEDEDDEGNVSVVMHSKSGGVDQKEKPVKSESPTGNPKIESRPKKSATPVN